MGTYTVLDRISNLEMTNLTGAHTLLIIQIYALMYKRLERRQLFTYLGISGTHPQRNGGTIVKVSLCLR